MQRQRNRRLKDYAGHQFGRLTALSLIERDWQWNNHLWMFRCECGNEVVRRIKNVRDGHTSSCGCLARETLVERNSTHGLSCTDTYRSWKDMRARCRNPNNDDYPNYGGRGLSVCDRWDDFDVFFADMGERPSGMTIDRIDTDGNYEPGNCRWATSEQQANNRRNNHLILINGEQKTLQQWSNEFGVESSKARYRLAIGYSILQSFSLGDFRR